MNPYPDLSNLTFTGLCECRDCLERLATYGLADLDLLARIKEFIAIWGE
jgi:hypothetical protein